MSVFWNAAGGVIVANGVLAGFVYLFRESLTALLAKQIASHQAELDRKTFASNTTHARLDPQIGVAAKEVADAYREMLRALPALSIVPEHMADEEVFARMPGVTMRVFGAIHDFDVAIGRNSFTLSTELEARLRSEMQAAWNDYLAYYAAYSAAANAREGKRDMLMNAAGTFQRSFGALTERRDSVNEAIRRFNRGE